MGFITIGILMATVVALIITPKTMTVDSITDREDQIIMHNNFHGDWFCGPGSFFSGFHFGGFFHLLLWVIVIFLIFKAISLFASGTKQEATTAGSGNPSLAILEKRYASGEIDQEEFLQKKQDLNS